MANGGLILNAKQQFFDAAGDPLVGGLVYTYAPGTLTPKTTYSDMAQTTPNANPIVLDARGECVIYGQGLYRVILKDSLLNTIYDRDGVDTYYPVGAYADDGAGGSIFTTIQGFINKILSSTGSTIVGFKNTLANAITRTVSARLNDTIRVNDFVTGGSGTVGDPWTGWDTAITWAPVTTYYFNDGHYAYTTSPNFAHVHLKLDGTHATVIHHTGSGYAMVFDAGATTGECVGLDICLRLEGNASSTGGVLQRGCTRSKFDMSFRNIPGTCFEEQTGVLNIYYLEHTAFVYGESIQPDRLLNVSRRAVGQDSSANIYYLRAENCTSTGVNVSFGLNSLYLSGTSEANGGGIYIETTSGYNTFINNDFEINSGLDIECRGEYNTFINCLSTTTAQFQGANNNVIGGAYNTIRAWGDKNNFGPLMYANAAGTFDVSGGTNYTKTACYNATSATLDKDVIRSITSINTGSGSVSATTAVATTLFASPGVGMYQVFCYVNSGDATNFTASATIMQESGGTARITSNNGGSLTLTLSGLNIQATQSSGATQTIVYSYLRIN